jgi:hypothetical protein
MAVTLTLLAAERGKGPFIEVEALLTFAGAYVAGGVQLDLTQLYSQTDLAGRNLDSDVRPLWAAARSKAALAGGVLIQYKVSTFTNPGDGTPAVPLTPSNLGMTPASALLQIFSGITELTSAAYPNNVLSDRVIMKAVFMSQR